MKVIKKRDDGSLRVCTVIEGESLTEQNHRPLCDINAIVARARETGIMPQVDEGAVFGDFSDGQDFLDMQCKLAEAKNLFHELPNKVRKHFKNQPGLFIDALATEEGQEEIKNLGVNIVDSSLTRVSEPEDKVAPPADDKDAVGTPPEPE